jgi:hypothetical protein
VPKQLHKQCAHLESSNFLVGKVAETEWVI